MSAPAADRAPVRTRGRAGDAARWLAALTPAALPPGVERTVHGEWCHWYRVRLGAASPLHVTVAIEVWDGELWAHLAVTARHAPPTLAEVSYCRDLLLGDRRALHVMPRRAELAEAGARTLHVLSPLEADRLPFVERGERLVFEDPRS